MSFLLTHSPSDTIDETSAEIDSRKFAFATIYTANDPEETYADPTATEAWLLSAAVEINEDTAVLTADLAEGSGTEGEVSVSLRRDPRTGEVVVRVRSNGNRVVVESLATTV